MPSPSAGARPHLSSPSPQSYTAEAYHRRMRRSPLWDSSHPSAETVAARRTEPTIARMGFRYVDIGSGSNLNTTRAAENPRKEAADIRADLELFNLKVSDLYLMLPRISMPEEDRRQKELDQFKALIPFAVALGTPGITLSPGLVHPAEESVVENAGFAVASNVPFMVLLATTSGPKCCVVVSPIACE